IRRNAGETGRRALRRLALIDEFPMKRVDFSLQLLGVSRCLRAFRAIPSRISVQRRVTGVGGHCFGCNTRGPKERRAVFVDRAAERLAYQKRGQLSLRPKLRFRTERILWLQRLWITLF